MSYDQDKVNPPPRPPENYLGVEARTAKNEAAVEVHPREIIRQILSQKCEAHIDQIAMLREMRAQVEFMGREEARLLLKAIRSAECTGLLRW